jgi:hypothetical protein
MSDSPPSRIELIARSGEAISWPHVIDQAESLLEKTGRKLT